MTYTLPDVPASPRVLTLFVEFLLRTFRSPKSVTNTLASVHHLHLQLGAPVHAFTHYRVLSTIRALPLTVRHLPSPALPVTPALLKRLAFASREWAFKGLVFFSLCTIAFHTLARLSSLVPPSPRFDPSRYPTFGDLSPSGSGFLLTVKFAKNAQALADSFTVLILPSTDPVVCPVAAILALRAAAGHPPPNTPLFHWPTKVDASACLPLPSLSAPEARRCLKQLLRKIGCSPSAVTFHSFRRGGCTTAALRGAAVGDLQALGHWHSDAVRAYFPALPAQLRAARLLTS